MSPEQWDPYNLCLLDDLIDWIRGWVEYWAEQLANLCKRIFGDE